MYSSGHWNFFWTLELFFSEHRNILLWRLEMFFILNIRNVFFFWTLEMSFSEHFKCIPLDIGNVFFWTLELFFSEHRNYSLKIGNVFFILNIRNVYFWTLEMFFSEHWKCTMEVKCTLCRLQESPRPVEGNFSKPFTASHLSSQTQIQSFIQGVHNRPNLSLHLPRTVFLLKKILSFPSALQGQANAREPHFL